MQRNILIFSVGFPVLKFADLSRGRLRNRISADPHGRAAMLQPHSRPIRSACSVHNLCGCA